MRRARRACRDRQDRSVARERRSGGVAADGEARLINLARLRRHIDDFGVGGLALSAARRGARHAIHARRRVTGTVEEFAFDGERYSVFHHPRNRTWLTERAIELPVAMRFVDSFGPSAVGLEVGNVLAHYRAVGHRVVDKYERAPGVENRDVLDITTDSPFDYVVAISTLEHVGWDEPEQDLDKPLRAIRHLRSLLRPVSGRMLVTLPLGYNPSVDVMVLRGMPDAVASQIFVRDRRQRWLPTDRPDPQQLRYEFELRTAAAVWIATFPPL